MASTVTELETPDSEPLATEQPELPDAGVLEDKFPEWAQATPLFLGFTAILGFIYLWLSRIRPLSHTDIWGHLAYGRVIWERGAVPSTEPLMPLLAGVPYVDTAWLSQLVGFGTFEAAGIPALQFLYAATLTACFGVLIWRCYSETQNAVLTVVGLLFFVWVSWQQFLIVRPQIAGALFFIALLSLLTRPKWSRANWFIVPIMFAFWANLHGSFPVGLGLLGCFLAGQAIDVFRETKTISAIFKDASVQRYFLLAELAAVATLLNPYGLGLHAEVFGFAQSANLADIIEWEPLQLRMEQGKAAAVMALALMFVYRMSPRRISAIEILLLLGLGAAALWTSRMILWWAPVAAYYFVIHASAIRPKSKTLAEELESEPTRRGGIWTVASFGLAMIFFCLSPIYAKIRTGTDANLAIALSAETPIAVAEYFEKNPPRGLVFNLYEWGDYLLWHSREYGPKELKLFVHLHPHLVPRQVWLDYGRVTNADAEWDEVLDRYSVNTVTTYRNSRLARRLSRHEAWELKYSKDHAAVFVRKEPIE